MDDGQQAIRRGHLSFQLGELKKSLENKLQLRIKYLFACVFVKSG